MTATDAAVQLLLLLLLLCQLLHCGCCSATNWDTTDALAATKDLSKPGQYQMVVARYVQGLVGG